MKKRMVFVLSSLGLLLVFALIYGCGTVTTTSTPAFVPKVIYQHAFGDVEEEGCSIEVMSMNPDGSGKTQLTHMPANDAFTYLPKMSPDGTKVAYVFDNGLSTIEVMNIDGTNRQVVATDTEYFCLSPNGNIVAYTQGNTLYAREIGSGRVQITTETVYGYLGMSWSSDGTKLAYRCIDSNIHAATMDGTNALSFEVLTTSFGTSRYPLFSPQSSDKMLCQILNGTYKLSIIDISFPPYQVTTLEVGSPDQYAVWSPPDGQWVYYSSIEAGVYDIYRIKSDGTVVENLTETADYEEFQPRFFPGSDRVFYTSVPTIYGDNSSEVYSMDANGFNKSRLTNNSELDAIDIYDLLL